MKILINMDLNQNELQNAVIQPLAAPPENPKEGQYYYNSNDKIVYVYNGTKWQPVGGEGAKPSNTTPKMDGEATAGTENTYARGDHTHPTDTSKVPTSRTINGKPLTEDITFSAADLQAIPTSEKGNANGVAELDETGKVPSSQLPSYVDDVIDAYIRADGTEFGADWLAETDGGAPLTPEKGKIYTIVSAGQHENELYRWSGSKYVPTGSDLKLGTTSNDAFYGDKGQIAYEYSQQLHQADWNEDDPEQEGYIKNKPALPPTINKTIEQMSTDNATYTVTGYILSVVLVDSVTKEQVIGDIAYDEMTEDSNKKVTIDLATTPKNPLYVIITSITEEGEA